MAPLRDAVSLVDGDQGGLALGQHLGESRHPQAFRRDEEELEPAAQIVHACLTRHSAVQTGVNSRDLEALSSELGGLIFHKRDQRAHDQGITSAGYRWKLITERLPRTRRHYQQYVVTLYRS